MEQKYYDLQQISEKILAPVSFLRKQVKEGNLKGNRIGKKFVVGEESLKEFMKATEVKTNGK